MNRNIDDPLYGSLFFILVMGLPFLLWAAYQFKIGWFLTNRTLSRYSGTIWKRRADAPFGFWATILGQSAAGLLFVGFGIFFLQLR